MTAKHEWPIVQMLEWYSSGMSTTRIAEILGSDDWQPHWIATSGKGWKPHKTSVATALKSAGCVIRNASERAIDRHPAKKPWPIETMIAMYNDGCSLQEIADILSSVEWQPYWKSNGCDGYRPSQKIVNKVLKKKITLRGRGAPGHRNGFWKGGRHLDKDGYVMIHMPESPMANAHGFVREHRLVMSEILGRDLLATEVVHHKDDCKQNNDESNLSLFDTNSDHIRETMAGKFSDRQQTAIRRKMALSRFPSLQDRKDSLVLRLHMEHKLSLFQIAEMIDHREATISRHLTTLGRLDRHSAPGTVTDLIREECRQFLAILDSSEHGEQA